MRITTLLLAMFCLFTTHMQHGMESMEHAKSSSAQGHADSSPLQPTNLAEFPEEILVTIATNINDPFMNDHARTLGAMRGTCRLLQGLITQKLLAQALRKHAQWALNGSLLKVIDTNPDAAVWLDALLAAGADKNACIQNRAIYIALGKNHMAYAHTLVNAGAELKAIYHNFDRPHSASFRARFDVPWTNEEEHECYILDAAACLGDYQMLERLADPTIFAKIERGNATRALMLAIKNYHADCVRLLLYKFDPVIESSSGFLMHAPLHIAAQIGFAEGVQALVDAGAHVNRRIERETPLALAIANGNKDTVRILLEAGADTAAQDRDGRTMADCARMHGQHEIAQMIESRQAIRQEAVQSNVNVAEQSSFATSCCIQ